MILKFIGLLWDRTYHKIQRKERVKAHELLALFCRALDAPFSFLCPVCYTHTPVRSLTFPTLQCLLSKPRQALGVDIRAMLFTRHITVTNSTPIL